MEPVLPFTDVIPLWDFATPIDGHSPVRAVMIDSAGVWWMTEGGEVKCRIFDTPFDRRPLKDHL